MDKSATKVMQARREFEDLVPRPWSRELFLAKLSEIRGRRVELTAVGPSTLQRAPCGILLAFADFDQILYDSGTSDYHIDHNILHEVGHIVLDHECSDLSAGLVTIKRLLPDLDASAVEKVMCRTLFDDVQESEAEMFADLLMAGCYSPYRRSAPMASLWGKRA